MSKFNRNFVCRAIFVSTILIQWIACVAHADSSLVPPPGGASVVPQNFLESISFLGTQQKLGKLAIVDVSGEKFNRAIQIETRPGALGEWTIQIAAPVTTPVKAGDVLLAHFWLRCEQSMTDEGYTTFTFELNHAGLDKAAQFCISAGKEWKEVFIPFVSQRNFPVGEARITFWLGYDRQTIDLADVQVVNYQSKVKLNDLPESKVTYIGQDASASWRQEALQRIEKIRKGDLHIHIIDSHGVPVRDAAVHAVLRRHAFGFGTCVDADMLVSNTRDALRYKQTILSLFNRAVFEGEMKWPATWNGVPPNVDRSMIWLRSHGIPVRGHNLVWPSWKWLPPQLKPFQNDPKMLAKITARHITYVVSHFRGQLVDWDVVNEPFTNHDLTDLLGGRAIMLQWYKLAHQADPDCRLFINDFGVLEGSKNSPHRENYYDTIKYLIDNGAPLGGIGIQSHFGTELPAPADIIKIVDHFSEFGLPIESTEVSLNLHDSQLQADYLRDYMIALFSEPKVQDIILWGFWQGRHWRPQGGIFAKDWSPKPAANVWIDLTQKQWSTDMTTLADNRGETTIRGFYGDYEISVTSVGKTKTVTAKIVPGGSNLVINLE